ncbi:Hypothetical protein NTJ_07867 [Nesidiocoris tenuis]|uniref:Uncharacterized protein n=1 Tax=Nesidiocoris tenuis TaxID=355587 RepID=A0ABN7ASM6_9HEMI|nr:Hypothetical protein NTJ_07867 [Nesidiocoris tenuis]
MQAQEQARELFPDVRVVTSHRYLGGCIGPSAEQAQFVKSKVEKWVDNVSAMAEFASESPQATHVAFTKSLQREWAYLQRVVNGCEDEYEPLKTTIQQKLTPAILGRTVDPEEHDLFSLPARLGGLQIENPVSTSVTASAISKEATSKLVTSITTGVQLDTVEHEEQVRRTLAAARQQRMRTDQERSNIILEALPFRSVRRIVDGNASQWLSAIPLTADNLDLSPTQFRDALSMRYGRDPTGLPAMCDGCGENFSLNHALNCKRGGQVKRGHDQIRDSVAAMAKLAWRGVTVEPVMQEGDDGLPGLVADIQVHGVWDRERASFFDTRVINADASSYSSRQWPEIAESAAREKHRKYDQAAENLHASFSPLICSCEGVLHREFAAFQRALISALAERWEKPKSQIAGWVRTRTSGGSCP